MPSDLRDETGWKSWPRKLHLQLAIYSHICLHSYFSKTFKSNGSYYYIDSIILVIISTEKHAVLIEKVLLRPVRKADEELHHMVQQSSEAQCQLNQISLFWTAMLQIRVMLQKTRESKLWMLHRHFQSGNTDYLNNQQSFKAGTQD